MSLVTTAFGATNTCLPIVTPPKTIAPGPKHTWSSKIGFLEVSLTPSTTPAATATGAATATPSVAPTATSAATATPSAQSGATATPGEGTNDEQTTVPDVKNLGKDAAIV